LEHGDDKATTVRGGDETRADALDDVRRRLARLETALAATARDGDEKTSFLRETPRVSQQRASGDASPRTTAESPNRRIPSRPTTSEKRMNDSGTPEPPPSRWMRRAWRDTRRFAKRLFRDDASEGE
jgi:hypothetical protein